MTILDTHIKRAKERFEKEFLGFTIADTQEGRFIAKFYKSFLTQELTSFSKKMEDEIEKMEKLHMVFVSFGDAGKEDFYNQAIHDVLKLFRRGKNGRN